MVVTVKFALPNNRQETSNERGDSQATGYERRRKRNMEDYKKVAEGYVKYDKEKDTDGHRGNSSALIILNDVRDIERQ